jgi:hypothetical protein
LEEKPRAGRGSGVGSGRHSRGWPGGEVKGWKRIWSWIWKAFSRLAWRRFRQLDKDLELDLEGILEAGLEEKPRAGRGSGAASGRHSRGWPGGESASWKRIWSWVWKARLAWRRNRKLEEDLELDLGSILEAGLKEKPRVGRGFGAGSGRHSRSWSGREAEGAVSSRWILLAQHMHPGYVELALGDAWLTFGGADGVQKSGGRRPEALSKKSHPGGSCWLSTCILAMSS